MRTWTRGRAVGRWARRKADAQAPPPDRRGGESTRSRIVESRRANRKFQYCTIGCTVVLIGVLGFLCYRIYIDARADIEQSFNRQQLRLVRQAGDRIASFLNDLTASLRYSARFLNTIQADHPGRVAAMSALYDRLGGRVRVSEVGYLQEKSASNAAFFKEYAPRLARCVRPEDACFYVLRHEGRRVDHLLAVAPVSKGDWLYAKVSTAALAHAFVLPVQSGSRGRAWLADGAGRVVVFPDFPDLRGMGLSAIADELGDARLGRIARRMREEERGFDWHLALGRGEKRTEGRRYLTAFSNFPVGEERWIFAVTAPSSEFVGLIRRGFRKGLLLAGFGFVSLILAVLLILDRERRRIRAEDKIHWSEQVLESGRRLQALFDGITDAIGILDGDFRIQTLNCSMARLFGREISELLNQRWEASPRTAVPAPFVERAPVVDTFKTGAPRFFEKSIVRADGGRMDLEYYTYPILDASGSTRQVILYLKDVSERKVLEKEVRQRDRLSIVGKMSAQVAHEIRNPLSAINLNAELLGDELSQFHGGGHLGGVVVARIRQGGSRHPEPGDERLPEIRADAECGESPGQLQRDARGFAELPRRGRRQQKDSD